MSMMRWKKRFDQKGMNRDEKIVEKGIDLYDGGTYGCDIGAGDCIG